jgi:hypothetical protein
MLTKEITILINSISISFIKINLGQTGPEDAKSAKRPLK